MKLYDSVKKEKIDFISENKNEINMYVCGPTLYSDIHIGNARPIVFFDVLSRYFKSIGYKVKYISNITDVDDKIIIQAQKENISELELVKKNKENYDDILKKLNIEPYYKLMSVVSNMDNIIKYIENLVNQNYAYESDGQIYFDVDKFKSYGELSKVNLKENIKHTRLKKDNHKKSQNDFLLWKKTKTGIKWETKWSCGRPGWHTECSTFIQDNFKGTIDIHGGGEDLKFPHHENENIQAKANKVKLTNYWMHVGYVNINDEKMSKSLGNVILVKDLLKEYSNNFIRLLLLKNTYTQPINVTKDLLKQIKKMDNKLNEYYELYNINKKIDNSKYIKELDECMQDSINTSNFIALFFKFMADININKEEKENILSYATIILGFIYEKKKAEIPSNIIDLVKLRDKYKLEKNYENADEIRNEILNLGYEIIDTRKGTKCKKI